jgi:hypothetical protein
MINFQFIIKILLINFNFIIFIILSLRNFINSFLNIYKFTKLKILNKKYQKFIYLMILMIKIIQN